MPTREAKWPDGAAAAVSLTYDDGEPDNLDHAIPDLEAAGYRGSFYLYKRGPCEGRLHEWKVAFERGHEIGNHTVRHPCRNDHKVRAKPLKNPLEQYTAESILAEINEAADWLDETIGVDAHRTFAYPCGNTAIGVPADETPYRAAVASRHGFARGFHAGTALPDNRYVVDPDNYDALHLPSYGFQDNRLEQFTQACDHAVAAGGWAILVFHSIGGRNHNMERAAHQALIQQLQQMPVWVAPVRDVSRYLLQRPLDKTTSTSDGG